MDAQAITVIVGAAVSALSAGGTAFFWWDNRQLNKKLLSAQAGQLVAETEQTEAEAAHVLAEADRVTAEVQGKAIQLSGEAAAQWKVIADRLDNENHDMKQRISGLASTVDQLSKELVETRSMAAIAKRYMAALEYLVDKVRTQFPIDVQVAEKIARGELALPVPYGNGGPTQ